MSDEQNETSLTAQSNDLGGYPQTDSDRVAQRAQIEHADGTREMVTISGERSWAGALPRPEHFEAYGRIVRDAPERILKMAEQEQAHRIQSETKIISDNAKVMASGQKLGFALSLTALLASAVCGYLDVNPAVSVALVGIPVLSVAKSLVSAFKSSE